VTRLDLIARIKNLLSEDIGLSTASLENESLPLVGADGSVDSVAILRLVVALEKEFGVMIIDEDIQPENFASLDALAVFVERKLA
jgi:acyl carrier protein